jgi:hypothetical protein
MFRRKEHFPFALVSSLPRNLIFEMYSSVEILSTSLESIQTETDLKF